MEEQTNANNWYNKMAQIADQYAAQMKSAAAKYAETDQNAANTIKSR